MKDFEQLIDEEQQDVIMKIGSKLDKQEMCYWMGLVHLLREQDKRIRKVREYVNKYHKIEGYYENIKEELLDILEGNDV